MEDVVVVVLVVLVELVEEIVFELENDEDVDWLEVVLAEDIDDKTGFRLFAS